MSKQFTLGKYERLKSRKKIEQLFNEGKSFSVSPYRLFYQFNVKSSPVEKEILQFGVGVPAKNFKRVVDRNRIKRLTREVWRLQKNILKEKLKEKNLSLYVFFIYTGKELPVYKHLFEKTGIALQKLVKEIE